ncbi:hypothetical protein HMPREF1246_2082 [Acidaminococcus sp. BV3L6]|nr:hypothetical protein HMPREF1246_2082 [Acidaminococcus sp. BV3L6]
MSRFKDGFKTYHDAYFTILILIDDSRNDFSKFLLLGDDFSGRGKVLRSSLMESRKVEMQGRLTLFLIFLTVHPFVGYNEEI